MQADDPAAYREELLMERIAGLLRFDSLSAFLPGDLYPPYLLVATALVIQYGVVDGYNALVADKSTIVTDPISMVTGIGVVLGIVGVRWMRDGYAEAVADLRLSQRDDLEDPSVVERFRAIVPYRLKLWGYAVGLVLFAANFVFLLGPATVLEIQGVVGILLEPGLVIPFVYLPLIVEFALLYVGIHVVLPRRIADADLELFFYDPRKMGGFAQVGQLLKRTYYLYTAGLLLYFALIYGPVVLSGIIPTMYPAPEAPIAVLFTLLWILGVASIAYSMFRLHTVMSAKKEREIVEIEAEIRDILDDPYDINEAHIDDPDTRAEIQHRLEQVRSTREYPSTFTMWSQIAISVLLPQALQLGVQVVP